MQNLIKFIRREIVLCVAVLLAAASSFIVKPDKEYISYIDYRTLAILFSLMCVMAGLKKIGAFDWVAQRLLKMVKGSRRLMLILVLICFFFSMLITNDVALITFVPFTFIVLKRLPKAEAEKMLIPTIVLQTVAANLGSMLTPIGNPQNLYLYGKSGISLGEFVLIMLPYTVLALVLLVICCIFRKNFKSDNISFENNVSLQDKNIHLVSYLVLFIICLLVVARILPYPAALAAVIIVLLVLDRNVLLKVDYSLLLTFVGFFIFIGNMGRIPAFCNFLANILEGHEVLTSIAASQIVSNVPAALLLSGFTANYKALIIGTNLGGLGTLIASMASLISYKYIATDNTVKKGRYLCSFTVVNVIFLIMEFVLYILIS